MSQKYERELSRFPSQSVTWVRVLENGDFQAEFYDHSCIAESEFAHDYSIINLVKRDALCQMKQLLSGQSDISDETLLELVCTKFEKRAQIEAWCKANKIECEYLYEQC